MNLVDNEVRFIEAFEPVTDFEAYGVSILVHMSTEVRFIEAFEPMTDLEDNVSLTSSIICVDNEVRFIEASEPVTDFEA